MGKTSKGTQAANQCRLLSIQPNQVPPGGPNPGNPGADPAPPAAPRFDITPEGIPQFTFIMEPRTAQDDFILGAETYHTNCGLAPQRVHSLGHLVELLSGETTHLRRIRLITHASGEDLIMPLFGQTNVQADRHTFEAHLRGFAESDERGLLSILMLNQGGHYFNWSGSQIMSMIRTANDALLEPFGLRQAGLPEGNLRQFIFYCCDYVMVQANRVRLNNSNLSAANKGHLLHAIDTLIDLAVPPATAGSAALKTFLTGRTINDLGLGTASYGYSNPGGALNFLSLARNAADAVRAGFRAKLTTVRGRFNENSKIDIRGCRAGRQASYLRAFQAFIGRTGHRPTVSGPRWFQYFGPCPGDVMNNNNDIRSLLRNGAQAAPNRQAFEQWAQRSQINARHKDFWLERLNTAGQRGNVIRFCQLNWRGDILPITLEIPGWNAFAAMSFSDSIARMGILFNVPNAAVPSGGSLNTINTFVTTQLDGFATFLFAQIDDSNKAANFTALNQIDSQLGTSIVPDSAPNPLQVSQIEGYQRDLIDHIESNQLSAIKNFMQVLKERIEDEENPGIYYYMLNIGMPVFLFRDEERMLNGHRLQVAHNKVVVHQDFRDAAFRQWVRSLWDGDLPPANQVGTMSIGQNEHRRFALMVEEPDPGDQRVFACPHPGYMEQLEIVTNTPDPEPFGL